MSIELTREELFNQVWERPMTKVAVDFGISDGALKKICDKHRIPVPGRGYWAKKAAGKKVERAHFRATTDPVINRVVIHGSPLQDLPDEVKRTMVAAKKRERLPENKVDVVAAPEDLDPKVASIQRRLEKAKPSEKGLVTTAGADIFDLEVGKESVTRAVAFLNALVTAAGDRGYQVVKGNRTLVFSVDGETLDLRIAEQITRSKHEPTEAELTAIARWERHQQQRHRSWHYSSWTPRPTPPEWDYAPSGHLQVIVNEGHYGHDGLRRTFGDGKTQRIETLINAILEAFATWSASIKAKRIEDERRQREWEEEKRRREEQRRRNALESKRIEALSKNLERWNQRQQILEFVAAVEAKLRTNGYDEPEAVREWITWANDYANRIDPLNERLPRLLHFADFRSWELGY